MKPIHNPMQLLNDHTHTNAICIAIQFAIQYNFAPNKISRNRIDLRCFYCVFRLFFVYFKNCKKRKGSQDSHVLMWHTSNFRIL